MADDNDAACDFVGAALVYGVLGLILVVIVGVPAGACVYAYFNGQSYFPAPVNDGNPMLTVIVFPTVFFGGVGLIVPCVASCVLAAAAVGCVSKKTSAAEQDVDDTFRKLLALATVPLFLVYLLTALVFVKYLVVFNTAYSDAWGALEPTSAANATYFQDSFGCCGWTMPTDRAEPSNCVEVHPERANTACQTLITPYLYCWSLAAELLCWLNVAIIGPLGIALFRDWHRKRTGYEQIINDDAAQATQTARF